MLTGDRFSGSRSQPPQIGCCHSNRSSCLCTGLGTATPQGRGNGLREDDTGPPPCSTQGSRHLPRLLRSHFTLFKIKMLTPSFSWRAPGTKYNQCSAGLGNQINVRSSRLSTRVPCLRYMGRLSKHQPGKHLTPASSRTTHPSRELRSAPAFSGVGRACPAGKVCPSPVSPPCILRLQVQESGGHSPRIWKPSLPAHVKCTQGLTPRDRDPSVWLGCWWALLPVH